MKFRKRLEMIEYILEKYKVKLKELSLEKMWRTEGETQGLRKIFLSFENVARVKNNVLLFNVPVVLVMSISVPLCDLM